MKDLMADNKNGALEICYKGLLIYLHKDLEKSRLVFSTTVFSEAEFLPLIVRSCVESLAQKKGASSVLKINEKTCSIELVQSVSFGLDAKKALKLFAFSARSWALTLKRVARKDLQSI